ncbi:hypothetical protein [Lacinutrix algicola]|nr:hypothetical protein [Lacinutrix algicola]
MNKFLLYINEVLESLDILTTTNVKNIKSSAKRYSKDNYLEEK